MERGKSEVLAEIQALEREEERLSHERRRLHDQLDKGFANDAAVERERKVSAERLEIHRRLDQLRALLRD